MKRRYYIIVLMLTAAFLLFLIGTTISGEANLTPKEEPNLRLETKDSKKDGIIDNWLYRDRNGVPVKWIRDRNRDGRPDAWSFFKDGKAFIEEEDSDNDGKVDLIQIRIRDPQGEKERYLMLVLKDNRNNTFEAREDTGWISEEDMRRVK